MKAVFAKEKVLVPIGAAIHVVTKECDVKPAALSVVKFFFVISIDGAKLKSKGPPIVTATGESKTQELPAGQLMVMLASDDKWILTGAGGENRLSENGIRDYRDPLEAT